MNQNLSKLLDIRQKSIISCAEQFCKGNINHNEEYIKVKNALDSNDIKLLEMWYDQKYS